VDKASSPYRSQCAAPELAFARLYSRFTSCMRLSRFIDAPALLGQLTCQRLRLTTSAAMLHQPQMGDAIVLMVVVRITWVKLLSGQENCASTCVGCRYLGPGVAPAIHLGQGHRAANA
jgi:hypothetical protein